MPNNSWQELYKAALLELAPDALRRKIEAARAAIQQRSQALSLDARNRNTNEAQRLIDALLTLRMLERVELKEPAAAAVERGKGLEGAFA